MSLFKSNFFNRVKDAQRTAQGCAKFQDINDLEQRLWDRADIENISQTGSGELACLVGFSGSDLASTKKILRHVGVQRFALFPQILQLYEVVDRHKCVGDESEEFSYVVVNLDSFDSLESGIDVLLAFRKIYKSVCVVLASTAVVVDDFSTERNSICDATLSLPLSLKSIETATLST